MKSRKKILLLGLGNYLMGDEGVGVHVAQKMEASANRLNIDVVDGGTGGFHLLGYFEGYEHVILVDATLDNHTTGTIRLIQPQYASDFPPAMSTHDIGLKDMVSALQLMGKMPAIHLYVVSIGSLQQQGVTLTPEIQHVFPVLIHKIEKLVKNLKRPASLAGRPLV